MRPGGRRRAEAPPALAKTPTLTLALPGSCGDLSLLRFWPEAGGAALRCQAHLTLHLQLCHQSLGLAGPSVP